MLTYSFLVISILNSLELTLIFFLLPSIFTAANCSPGKCFIISFVSFKFFLVSFLFPYYSLIPSALDEAGLFTKVEMKTNNAHNVFPFAVFPYTLLRGFMISMLDLNLFQNVYIPKRLDILYIKPTFYLHTITYTV